MRIYHQAQLWNTLEVHIQPNPSRIGRMHTLGFSLGIESNHIDRIAVPHAVVKHRFVNDHVLGG